MRNVLILSTALTITAAALACGVAATTRRDATPHQSRASRVDIDYLEAVNRVGPPHDPQLLFLLMGAYANAGEQAQGVEFLTAQLTEFGPRLDDAQKSLYLSAIAALRAQHAPSISLFRRIGYVRETIAMLDDAKRLSGSRIFVVNWMSGVVRSQLPGLFGQRQAARDDLTWCAANIARAPHIGWLREVNRRLGTLALADGDEAKAQAYLRASGYTSVDQPVLINTAFTEDPSNGHAFAARRITEVVPGRVYMLSGFEFTEYYFVVSDNGRELIGIDAGTRDDSAQAAYEALRAHAPQLPPLTTIFITHAHWDHVGGHRYFRRLTPVPRFYARSNFQDELADELNAPSTLAKPFFGERFSFEAVQSFKPDATIDRATHLDIGGTRIELIPIHGGETRDGMFIHVPDLGVLFAGDFIMPYIGAPFAAEGDVPGLLEAIDVVIQKHPRHILHGHEPLTRAFASADMLAQLKTSIAWLRDQVLIAIRRGDTRPAIHEANLIPPGFLNGREDVFLPYLLLREHVIDRLYHQHVGYWGANLEGLDHLSDAERGAMFVRYLGLSEQQIVRAAEQMVADGHHELAASLLQAAKARLGETKGIAGAERLVYLKLMEKWQNYDPFKYILYSARIGQKTPPMTASH
jgi:glyoxylase-like metal-dependent hydrolase (beta-lactamase superfamily II)